LGQDFENSLSLDHDELDGLLVGIFESINEADLEGTFRRLDIFWARLAVHIRAEHIHLFPAISGLSSSVDPDSRFAKLPDQITRLRADHEYFMKDLSAIIKSMRAAENNRSEVLKQANETLIALKGRLLEHNRIEEEQIYNVGKSFLEDIENISAAVETELANLPPRLNSEPIEE
jgi:hemerythrin superfamily protein